MSDPEGASRRPVVMLVMASWAEASRPSLSTIRELGRRHADRVDSLLVDLADDPVTPVHVAGSERGVQGLRLLADVPGTGDENAAEAPSAADAGFLLEAPATVDAVLDGLRIDLLPTWLRFECHEQGGDVDHGPVAPHATLRETARVVGATPKHRVEAELYSTGPG